MLVYLSSILAGPVGPTNILQEFSGYPPGRAVFIDPDCASLILEIETMSTFKFAILNKVNT